MQYIIGNKLMKLNVIEGYKLVRRTSIIVILEILLFGKISYRYSLLNYYNATDSLIKYVNRFEDKVSIVTFFMLELISFYDPESTISMINKKLIFSKLYKKVKFKPMWLIRLWTKLIYNRGIQITRVENESKYFFNYNFGTN